MVLLGEAHPSIWDIVIEKLEKKLEDFEFKGEDIVFEWKKMADQLMAERSLDEKYGIFKRIALHPMTNSLLEIYNSYFIFSFDFILGDPILPWTTAIILLFMLHKRISNDFLALCAAFLFNLNPVYVVGGMILWKVTNFKKKPKQFVTVINCETSRSNYRFSSPHVSSLTIEKALDFDHVLIGDDISVLYTASLLSKVGHKCCVLGVSCGPAVEVHPENYPCPITLRNLTVGKIDRYQSLLDAAAVSLKPQHRVLLAPIGSPVDGYTHTILRRVPKQLVPQPSTASTSSSRAATGTTATATATSATTSTSTSSLHNDDRSGIFAIRSGKGTLAEDLSHVYGADRNMITAIVTSLIGAQQSLAVYLMSRIQPSQWSAASKEQYAKSFFEVASNTCSRVLSRIVDVELRDLLTSVSICGMDEIAPAKETSAIVLANALGQVEEGMHYPVGGLEALRSSLYQTIEAAGGKVYRDVSVIGLQFTVIDAKKNITRVTGVRVAQSPPIQPTADSKSSEIVVSGSKSVVSGLGVLCTYSRLVPNEYISSKLRADIAPLSEARPKVLVCFWLKGTVTELGLTPCDYFECPARYEDTSATGSHGNEDEAESNAAADGFIDHWVKIWSPSTKDRTWTDKYSSSVQTVVVELGVGDLIVKPSLLKFKAAATNQPAAIAGAAVSLPVLAGPKVYIQGERDRSLTSTTHTDLSSVVVLSKGQKDRLKSLAVTKLQEAYPLITNQTITHTTIVPPHLGGHSLASGPQKFASTVGAISEIPGLYLCGSDFGINGFAGDLQGGWVAANAILGYTGNEMLGGRDIITDLRNLPVTATGATKN